MPFCKKITEIKQYTGMLVKWCLLSTLMGSIGGLLGAGFHHGLDAVTHLRMTYPWLVAFLPVGGLVTVGLYRALRLQANRGTNEVVEAVLWGRSVHPVVAPAVFAGSLITHLLGGSAGREGAALQIGGAVASLLQKLFRLQKNESSVMTVCGMSAVFSGLFGLPVTAGLFTLEFESVGTLFFPALLPCFVSSLVACKISAALGTHPVTAMGGRAMVWNWENAGKLLVLAIGIALLGVGMCHAFRIFKKTGRRLLKNHYSRALLGGVILIALTGLVGDQRFNGAGMEMAMEAILHGQADWYDFLLKLLFTAVTLAAGFKGGEIVPTFCIGATFGCVAGGILGLDPGFAAMVGLVGLFCAATNSPLTAIVLSVEMFGVANLQAVALVCVVAFLLSGNVGLYSSQRMEFSKFTMKKNRKDPPYL